ncbi:MAG: glycosyltransferase family 2 protein [Deltaproteobacteria bacterium]|nr:glycosyltransferase family 2 protein [Deltaproteobacteria bacterium]
MAAPLVSVLLPARDAAATLAASLASVRRQRFADWECVVVDDGSLDETAAVAQRFAAADPRFVVVPAARAGLVAALNAGLARCRGAFVARMDADDLMHRDRLAAQVEALASSPALAAVAAHVRIFPRGHLAAGWRAYERWVNGIASAADVRAEAFVECPVVHPTLTFRRAALATLGYRDAGWPEDYDLVLRALARNLEIGVVPRRLHAWRDRPGRLSRTGEAYALPRFTALKAAFLAERFLAASDRYVLWGYGGTGRALHRALALHGKRATHVVEVHPGRVGNTIHGAPVIGPDALRALPPAPIVVSVARSGPRGLIRAALADMGFRELRDFVCAA